MEQRDVIVATNVNLRAYGPEPLMRWLIAAVLEGSHLTYLEIRERLEQEVGFTSVFTTRIGGVAGELMTRIWEVDPSAPLLNALVVNKKDELPGGGAAYYFGEKYKISRLKCESCKENNPALWRKYSLKAAAEVYAYGIDRWIDIYHKVFNLPLSASQIMKDHRARQKGTEKDGIMFGRDGEGHFHKSLRLWTLKNPSKLHKRFMGADTKTEVDIASGDRIDVVYWADDRVIVIEVKSRISNDADLLRGIFQCVKYRAVREAMAIGGEASVEAWLVTETELPSKYKSLLKIHNINHFVAPQDR